MAIREPRITLSRPGPRNPLHAGGFGSRAGSAAAGEGLLVTAANGGAEGVASVGSLPSVATGTAPGGGPSGAAGGGAGSGSVVCASRRCSGVGDQRHLSCGVPSPVMPSVLASVHTRQPAKMAATMVTRRVRFDRFRVATAQATNARLKVDGTARTKTIMPIAPFSIDSWTTCLVTSVARIINPRAANRSAQAARLKNSHQSTITARPPSAAKIP